MPLTDAKIRKAKPIDKPQRLFDGGGLYESIEELEMWTMKQTSRVSTDVVPKVNRFRVVMGLAALGLLVSCIQLPQTAQQEGLRQDWPAYLGGAHRNQYSNLDQIDRDNVGQLEMAWTFETGDTGQFQANPIIVGGLLYIPSPARKVFAVDATTGEEVWRFEPGRELPGPFAVRQRGVVYWGDGGESRIFTSAGGRLFALDADTGEVVRSFGENGSIDLGINTPGVVFEDLLIVGMLVEETNQGGIRAYDVRTGGVRWHFNTIPRPGEYGYETWPPDAWKTVGGASDWSGQSLDLERGIVFASTETAGPDFYGAERHGDNLFANSVVALDARTGERIWHFQTVRHDLNDFDLPAPPELVTVTHDGRRIEAIAQGTKYGVLFVLNRDTGEPLFPMVEYPVPASRLPGEQPARSQPLPVKPPPLMRHRFTVDDVSNISAEARADGLAKLAEAGSTGLFPTPYTDEAILFPGFDGGFEWGGSAIDPDGMLYTNINEIPWLLKMEETRNRDGSPVSQNEQTYRALCGTCHGMELAGNVAAGIPGLINVSERYTREALTTIVERGLGRMPGFGADPYSPHAAAIDFLYGVESETQVDPVDVPPYAFTGWRRFLDREGYPAIKPPWGTLNAVNLNTGKIEWRVTLGEYAELTARGLPPTGTETYGGPISTSGGLLFIGATADEKFRAFDKSNGDVLWEVTLPFGGFATPATYMVDGKQYVVIAAGGEKVNTKHGGSIVAFALPD